MLQHLSVKNYALIDHLDLEWSRGFTVITGETGAGKSILLKALSLILGKRADLKSVKNTDQKCVVEGTFNLQEKTHSVFFKSHDLDFEASSILRREISPSGKSRAFINDTPVTLDVLETLTARLIDVHSQHQNLLLSNAAFQLELLDSFADNEKDRQAYHKIHATYLHIQKQLQEEEDQTTREAGDSDYLQFLFNELEEAQLVAGEQEKLEEALERGENAGEIQQGLDECLHLLETGDQAVVPALQRTIALITSLQRFDPALTEIGERLRSCHIELDDLGTSINQALQKVDQDPAEVDRLDQRLSLLLNLQKKHGAHDLQDLLHKKEELELKIQSLTGRAERVEALQAQLAQAESDLEKRANVLHQSRLKVIPALEEEAQSLLSELNLPQSSFHITLEKSAQYHDKGRDQVQFLFSANAGQVPAPLNRVASGGEMSRVMLALKAIMARTQNLPAIIFDEIDTGVSGETARKIGEILNQMGKVMQVIAISHLPQIASLGNHHLKVIKTSEGGETYTRIKPLEGSERVDELARMLSGDRISEAARQNALHLLNPEADQ